MRALVLVPSWAWLLLFAAAPAALLGAMALATSVDDVPPFALGFATENLAAVVSDPFYRAGMVASLRVAAISTVVCLLIGYPMALAIARLSRQAQSLLLFLVMLPFWTGFLLRIAAWIGLLRDDGWINRLLLALRVIAAPLPMLHTDGAMVIGIVYAYLPFMILPLQARLSRMDPQLEQAAADLGASPLGVFWRVTLPLSLPGVLAGCALVFIPVTGEYVIPDLLGAADSLTMGRMVWDTFFEERDWPMAAALAVVPLVLMSVPLVALRMRRTRGRQTLRGANDAR